MTFDSLMIHNITKHSVVSSQNMLGEWTHTYTAGSTSIPCRINPLTAAEMTQLAGIYDDVKHKCYMKSSSTVTRGDRITYNDETYKVREVVIDSSSHHKTAYLVLQ